jgi:hypothetical protein
MAMEDGTAPADAMIAFASQFPSALEKIHPEAYSSLMSTAVRRALDDLLPVARARADADPKGAALLNSLQHIEQQLFGKFTRRDDIKLPDPAAALQTRERSAQQELNELKSKQAQESWGHWQKSTNDGIQTGVEKEIDEAINSLFSKAPKALAALKKNNPDEFQAQVNLLNSKVREEFKANAELRAAVQVDIRNARIAASEQKRQERSENIVNRHSFAARRVIQQLMPKVSKVLNAATKGALDAVHQRRATASQHRSPSGSGGEVKTSLVSSHNPATGAKWSPDEFASQVDKLFR